MPSYVVTGASRGIGLEYVRQLSLSPENIVIALVRNKATALAVPSSLLKNPPANVHVLEADVTDHNALKAAAEKVAELTGGHLDMLINNAATANADNNWRTFLDFEGEDELLEEEFERAFKVNVMGVIYSTNSFLPLLRKGTIKKIITIGSGGDLSLFKLGHSQMVAYGASKAAVNMVVTKFAITLQKEGVVVVAVSPGLVDTLLAGTRIPKNAEWMAKYTERITQLYPDSGGMQTPEVSVRKQLKVIEGCTIQDTGGYLSIRGQ